ncbi:MAG: transcriptional repressor [Chloroflexota bacterium]|nr:transcriptional repressor [Chloroflexota bacterium]
MKASLREPWSSLPGRLRERGLRWTPQRRTVIQVLARTRGHITGAELIDRCRRLDSGVVPSTVYRTLDVLEQMGLVRHGHGADGREEFHVGSVAEHGHLHCATCGSQWEITDPQAREIATIFAPQGFEVDASHVTIVGQCQTCRSKADSDRGVSTVPHNS